MDRHLDVKLDRSRPIASLFCPDVRTFLEAGECVAALPYARNSAPYDKLAALKEAKGTCSTKHALLAELAHEQGLPYKLTLCFFEMSAETHPAVAPVLASYGLESILEAHCILSSECGELDFTGLSVGQAPHYTKFVKLHPDNLAKKKSLHEAALASWARQQGLRNSLDVLWEAREACIAALQKNAFSSSQ